MSPTPITHRERLPYLRALIAIAHADGVLDDDEAHTIMASAESMALPEDELATVRRDLAAGIDVAGAVHGAAFSTATRCKLLRDAYVLAWSDTLVTPEELRALQALAEALGLVEQAPMIQAWAERHLGLERDWAWIVEQVGQRGPKV